MAGVSESKAEALHRQGVGLAKHKGYARGSERWNAAVYGTKRAGGWHPSREGRRKKVGFRAALGKKRKR